MSGRLKCVRVLAALLAVGLLFAAATAMPAMAASHEQIVDMCRQAMHPQIMACALAKGLRGNPEAVRQQCGAAIVRPCVMREEQKQAAGVRRQRRRKRYGESAATRAPSNRLCRAAAYHRRHHRDSRQRKAGRCEDRQAQSRGRGRAAEKGVRCPNGGILLRPRQCPRAARPQQGSTCRRIASARGRQERRRIPATVAHSAICLDPIPSARRSETRDRDA